MAKFLTLLGIEEISQDHWRVIRPLEYQSDLIGLLNIPIGFETDLESIPRWLPLVYAILYGSAHAPAVVHDYLYTTGNVSRKIADDVLYEAIIATGHSRFKAWPIWIGVRAGGWVAWNRHRKEEQHT